jgi:hypothetical protein
VEKYQTEDCGFACWYEEHEPSCPLPIPGRDLQYHPRSIKNVHGHAQKKICAAEWATAQTSRRAVGPADAIEAHRGCHESPRHIRLNVSHPP